MPEGYDIVDGRIVLHKMPSSPLPKSGERISRKARKDRRREVIIDLTNRLNEYSNAMKASPVNFVVYGWRKWRLKRSRDYRKYKKDISEL